MQTFSSSRSSGLINTSMPYSPLPAREKPPFSRRFAIACSTVANAFALYWPPCHIAFDEATAILAGDGLQTLAFEQLLEAQQLPPQTTLRLLAMLTKAAGIDGMVYGQAIDMAAVNQTLTLPQLEHMHRHKTGAMISASVMMGGMTAGASEGQLGALKDYGEAIGLAFQVQDDILDVTTDTAVLGKQQGSDQARNKPTYLSLLGLDGARQKAAELHSKSLSALASFDECADQLRAIANYIVKREY